MFIVVMNIKIARLDVEDKFLHCLSATSKMSWWNKTNKMQQLRFFIRNGFTLHVSGDNLTHHQEYNSVYSDRWAGSLQVNK
jgi:hypothetical protein